MVKVKEFLTTDDETTFGEEINKFLETIPAPSFIDIKYSLSSADWERSSERGVLIIYRAGERAVQ